MKKTGSGFEYMKERDADLLNAYRKCISSCGNIELSKIWTHMSRMPSSRFWVSEERASIVMAKMFRGDMLNEMTPTKREMYHELFSRVVKIRQEKPELSMLCACAIAVNTPAPKFYMTPLTIRENCYRAKRRWHEGRKKKLQ